MTAPQIQADEVHVKAAMLTFAFLRFENEATHPDPGSHPPGAPRIGEDAFVFLPALRPVAHADIVSFLAGLPSPAILATTTRKGIISLSLLSELSGERARGAKKVFANQRAIVEESASQLGITSDSEIQVSLPNETLRVSLDVVRHWSERFAVQVGWNIVRGQPGAWVKAQFGLFRSDGVTNLSSPD